MKVLHMLALGGVGGIESLCVDIARCSEDENFFYFVWGGGDNTDKIKQLTDNVEVRKFSYKNMLYEYLHFEKYCIKNKCECIVVQGMSPIMILFATKFKKRYKNKKIVIYFHNNAHLLFKKRSQLLAFTYAYKYVDGCIAISESVKRSIEEAYSNSDKVKVIYNGVDVSKYAYHPKDKHNEPYYLIYVGRLIPQKGVDLLIKAIALLNIQCELYVIGDGPERQNLEKLSKDLNIDKYIHFEGKQLDISKWLEKADVFVHPATWEEGFGITLIESMAIGLPCIAFHKGAIPEIITNSKNGFIVDKVSVESLASKIKEVLLMINTETWPKIQYEARIRALDFEIGKYVLSLSTYLKSL